LEVLNLFGYTGGATLACAQAGANVVHIDSSKSAVAWARENAEASGLADKPIRWIIEDARIFVERELKRGRKYDGIIMDPPAFGHGPSSELWKIEEHFLALIENCKQLLKDKPLFFLINGYSAGYSGIAYRNNLLPLVEKFGGEIETGELTIQEVRSTKQEAGRESQERLLPAGIFARWSVK
jgi:23S rRNA (cytosine1962-C5)-methyltransferase